MLMRCAPLQCVCLELWFVLIFYFSHGANGERQCTLTYHVCVCVVWVFWQNSLSDAFIVAGRRSQNLLKFIISVPLSAQNVRRPDVNFHACLLFLFILFHFLLSLSCLDTIRHWTTRHFMSILFLFETWTLLEQLSLFSLSLYIPYRLPGDNEFIE